MQASSSAIPAHIKASREYKQQVKIMSSGVTSESLSPSALQAQKHLLARGMYMALCVMQSVFSTLEKEVWTHYICSNSSVKS